MAKARNEIYLSLTVNGLEIVRIVHPLNPRASLLGQLDVTIAGWDTSATDLLGDSKSAKAYTEFTWNPPAPIIVPSASRR